MKLTKEQIDFFETFGFIKFPGLLKDDIKWITDEFEQVFPMFEGNKHDGSKRTMIVPFIDQRERLSSLLDDSRVNGILTSLLGENYNYMGSDGNYYTGDTPWHRDGECRTRKHIKVAFYLDPLNAANGALRVIPGSHRLDDQYGMDLKKLGDSFGAWGVQGHEVPAQALDVVPGDVLVFDHNTFHSSWGGNTNRRMFTMNLSERFNDKDIEELRSYIVIHGHYHRDHYYGQAMLNKASSERLIHLEQVIEHSKDYAEKTKHLQEFPKRV